MKTKSTSSSKKPHIALKDLKASKNPKGGGFGGANDTIAFSSHNKTLSAGRR